MYATRAFETRAGSSGRGGRAPVEETEANWKRRGSRENSSPPVRGRSGSHEEPRDGLHRQLESRVNGNGQVTSGTALSLAYLKSSDSAEPLQAQPLTLAVTYTGRKSSLQKHIQGSLGGGARQ